MTARADAVNLGAVGKGWIRGATRSPSQEARPEVDPLSATAGRGLTFLQHCGIVLARWK